MVQTLRDYQLAACAELEKTSDNIILCGPTGCGKTTIIAEIVKRCVEAKPPRRVLLLAHRRELIYQPTARIVRHGVDPKHIGVIMGKQRQGAQGHVADWMTDVELFRAVARQRRDALVYVASVQTLAGRKVPEVDEIMIDEGHRTGAATYQRVIKANPNARVVALTATPDRADKSLHKTFKRIVVFATYRRLIDDGHLVKPVCYGRGDGGPDLAAVPVRRGEYQFDALCDAVDKPALIGDIVDHWRQRSNGAPTLVFATGVKHSKNIRDQFRSAGIVAEHVDGETPADKRERAFADLGSGAVQVVCNAEVATEGVDIPAVKCVVLARPTKSVRIYLQQVGRGSRPCDSPHPFVVLDHAGVITQPGFGLPHADRFWTLDPPKSKKKGEPQPPPVKTCPQCGALVAPSRLVCDCGYEWPKKALEHTAGELRELRELDEFELREAWKALCLEWRCMPRRPPAWWLPKEFQRRYLQPVPAGMGIE